MVEVIGLGRRHGYESLEQVMEKALSLGCSASEAIRYLLLEGGLERRAPEAVDTSALASYDRPLPELTDYDSLLSWQEVRGRAYRMEVCARKVSGSIAGCCGCPPSARSSRAWRKRR